MLGELVAAGGADLKVLAVHIRTADANPDEIQVCVHEPHAVHTARRLPCLPCFALPAVLPSCLEVRQPSPAPTHPPTPTHSTPPLHS